MPTSNCPICNHEELKDLFSSIDTAPNSGRGESFTITKCLKCNVAFTNPMPDENSISNYYPKEYYGSENKKFSSLFEKLIVEFRRLRAKEVESICPSGTVLDVGCGRGWMLSILKDAGYTVIGTELTEGSATFAKKNLLLDIRVGKFEDLNIRDSSVDVLTMYHCFEHLHSPKEILKKAKSVLKDDGYLLISVPNFGSLQSQLSKGKWFHLDVPRHLYHYSVGSLESLIEEAGFEVTKKSFTSLEYNFFGMIQSFYNVLGIKTNLLYDLIRNPKARLLSANFFSSLVGVFFMVLLSPLVIPWSIVLTIATDVTPLGGSINILAQKQSKNKLNS